ncbi:LytTR family DNA-binding domain-containing protein [Nesterenkonia massiliensis]|uniref:LytTR family DNA-binding domain-containing protein n=1 Tax=Nesterenkonia massiliensis TaxID=1232429 RepID=A0ABT2HPY6_9MICC|nr:LytTR family DNA-binding domain-containing protein [Nesterenkonia massiliensis]MCT1606737.1 LytTR family DNA-binding domain-containing protein [Nesterenkonia massiliensis]
MQPRALIVDDEAPAREELRYLLEEAAGTEASGAGRVQVVGEATNGEEALLLLNSLNYDLVFLDIRMPGLTGLEVAQRLRENPRGPRVIFTTAYPDHAVEAFDLSAADYLVKPFDAERLRRAVERALNLGKEPGARDDGAAQPVTAGGATGAAAPQGQDIHSAAAANGTGQGPAHGHGAQEPSSSAVLDPLVRIPVQKDGRTVLVDGEAIVYAAAARGYSSLKLADDKLLVSFSLNELERRLQGHFFRVHRSYLVNLRYVRELVPDFRGTLVLVMNDRQRSRVEVSRRHARELRKRLGV